MCFEAPCSGMWVGAGFGSLWGGGSSNCIFDQPRRGGGYIKCGGGKAHEVGGGCIKWGGTYMGVRV